MLESIIGNLPSCFCAILTPYSNQFFKWIYHGNWSDVSKPQHSTLRRFAIPAALIVALGVTAIIAKKAINYSQAKIETANKRNLDKSGEPAANKSTWIKIGECKGTVNNQNMEAKVFRFNHRSPTRRVIKIEELVGGASNPVVTEYKPQKPEWNSTFQKRIIKLADAKCGKT